MKIKKFLSIIIALAIVPTVLTGFGSAAYASTSGASGDLKWSLNTYTGVFTVSGNGYGKDYQEYVWSVIANSKNQPWYSDRNKIKSVVINDGVNGIGDYWFYNCENLTSVTFADSVDTIGNDVFKNCKSLTGVVLPENATNYLKEIFYNCTSLKWASLPKGNSSENFSGVIPDGVFGGCTALEEVFVGAEHTGIGAGVFTGCSALKSIVWSGDTLSSIDADAMSGASDSCRLVGKETVSGATDLLSFQSVSGRCGDGMSYEYNCDEKKLSLAGSGDMASVPWSIYHYFINSVVFTDMNGEFNIAPYAFYEAENTTSRLDIPEQCAAIGEKAFFKTGFNNITAASEKIAVGENAFSGDTDNNINFFGVAASGLRDYVNSGKESGYSWNYYCLNDNHAYVTDTVKPTCVSQGYDLTYCCNCDTEPMKSNYKSVTEHTYVYMGVSGSSVLYRCDVCKATELSIDAVSLLSEFVPAITHYDGEAPYKHKNYDGKFDLNRNGYINAKDFSLIKKTVDNVDTSGKETVIDASKVYQTIDGFGASGAWWAQNVGAWDNIDEIMSLLYSRENGAGLSIYRYNLGAGSENDENIIYSDRRTQCFLQSDGTYDWSRDANAQAALAAAKRANKDLKVALFSNSPPVLMTDNGKAYCSTGTASNLSESNYDAYARFIEKCAEHFIDEGYNVTSVSPINEPELSVSADENGYAVQEGCGFTDTAARDFYNKYAVPRLMANSRLNGIVRLGAWECAQMNNDMYFDGFLNNIFSSRKSVISSSKENYGANNENIRGYVNSFSTHSYRADESDRKAVCETLSKSTYSAVEELRCTEYCQLTDDKNTGVYARILNEGTTNGLSIEYGLALADIMYQDLTILNAVEWDWWTAVGFGIYPDSLIYVSKSNHNDIKASKRLWVMGNYSKFIQSGAKRVEVTTGSEFAKKLETDTESYTAAVTDENGKKVTYTDKNNYIEQSAYVNPDSGVVVVYINNSDTNEYTSFSDEYSSFVSYVTDEKHNLERYQSGNATEAVGIPAKSVTTVLLTPKK